MEPILSAEDRAEVKRMLDEAMKGDVTVDLYTRKSALVVPGMGEPSQTGPIAVALLGEVAALSDKIKLSVHDAAVDPEPAKAAGVEGLDPVLVFRGAAVKGTLRYLGLPAGYEFRTLLDTLMMVSSGEPELSPPAKNALAQVAKPVHLQVFVTPT